MNNEIKKELREIIEKLSFINTEIIGLSIDTNQEQKKLLIESRFNIIQAYNIIRKAIK